MKSLIFALFSFLTILSPIQAQAQTLNINPQSPTPTLPFKLAAFQSPFPPIPGQLSGILVSARDGFFWVDAKKNVNSNTVLWVDAFGGSWLNSAIPQRVYVNTRTGALSYTTATKPLAAGANILNFAHLGEGSVVAVPVPSDPNFFNAGPSTFAWDGSVNDGWFLCPRPGKGYQVLKFVGGKENWDACEVVQLVALDYKGVNPAVGVYP